MLLVLFSLLSLLIYTQKRDKKEREKERNLFRYSSKSNLRDDDDDDDDEDKEEFEALLLFLPRSSFLLFSRKSIGGKIHRDVKTKLREHGANGR